MRVLQADKIKNKAASGNAVYGVRHSSLNRVAARYRWRVNKTSPELSIHYQSVEKWSLSGARGRWQASRGRLRLAQCVVQHRHYRL